MHLDNEIKWTKWCTQQYWLSSWLRPLGVSVFSINVQKFSLCFSLSLFFFFVDVDMAYLFNQYEFRMWVEVMAFTWKMTTWGYSIWFPYILSVVIESNIEFSFSFWYILYLTFGTFQPVNYIFTLAIYVVIDLEYSICLVTSERCCMYDLIAAQSSVVG